MINSTRLTKAANALARIINEAETVRKNLNDLRATPVDNSKYASVKSRLDKVSRTLNSWTVMKEADLDEVTKTIATEQVTRLEEELTVLKSELNEAMLERQQKADEKSEAESALKKEYMDKKAAIDTAYALFQQELEAFEAAVAAESNSSTLISDVSSSSGDIGDLIYEEDTPKNKNEIKTPVVKEEEKKQDTEQTRDKEKTPTPAPVASNPKPEPVPAPVSQNSTTSTAPAKKVEADENDDKEDEVPDVLGGLLSAMRKFHEAAYEYDKDIDVEYSKDLKAVWSEVKLTEDEKTSIRALTQHVKVKGLDKPETYVLKSSIPTELLNLCGLKAFAQDRAINVENYFDGFLNRWRPKFTYNVIKEMCDLINSGAPYKEVKEFFANNKDTRVPTGKILSREKMCYKAFADV